MGNKTNYWRCTLCKTKFNTSKEFKDSHEQWHIGNMKIKVPKNLEVKFVSLNGVKYVKQDEPQQEKCECHCGNVCRSCEVKDCQQPKSESWQERFDLEMMANLVVHVYETKQYEDIKQFIAQELSKQKKELIERVEEECSFASKSAITDFAEGYREAISDAVQAINKK